MLNYITLDYKQKTDKKDKEGVSQEYLDLLMKTWDSWDGDQFINPVIVNEYYVARPDLISLAMYGTDEYGDMICKFNGISNPFELNEGMVIQIPPMGWSTKGTENREFTTCDLIQDESSDSFVRKNELQVSPESAHSSAVPVAGSPAPYIIDRTLGIVIY